MNGLVLDASIALEWFLTAPDSGPAWAKVELLDAHAPVVPAIWRLEVSTVIAQKVQQGRLPIATARTVLAELLALPIAIVDESPTPTLMQLAVDRRLTTYDAAYLDVAMTGGWPLATMDRELIRAAGEVGVAVA